MKHVRISEKNIINFQEIKKYPEMETLFSFLIQNKVKIAKSKKIYLGSLPKLTQLFWTPSNGKIYPIHKGELPGRVRPKNTFHDGFHYLIAKAFNDEVRGFPLFILLSETVASFTDIYIVTELFKKGQGESPWVKEYLNLGNHSKFLQCFNEWLRNPFEIFRSSSIELFNFLKFLNSQLTKDLSKEEIDCLIENRVKKLKYFPLYAQFDFCNYLFFAKIRCGKSCKKDLIVTSHFMRVLKSAGTFQEFLSILIELARVKNAGRNKKSSKMQKFA